MGVDTSKSGILDAQLFSEKGDFASCSFKRSLKRTSLSVLLAAHPWATVHTIEAIEIVWRTAGMEVGDAWSDYLKGSKDLISDWRKPLSCGSFNVKTGKCSGQQ